jgi:tRNA threonylcarbamoyladenosine biosynthesis protein TsaE
MRQASKQSHIVRSLQETDALAARLVKSLVPQKGQAVVLLLSGDLGAGKTTFTKAVARALGVSDPVISPTFILEKKYKTAQTSGFKTLVHIDAYRFENESESKVLQLEESLLNPLSLIVIEWPEKLGSNVPKNGKTIFFEGINEITKKITW